MEGCSWTSISLWDRVDKPHRVLNLAELADALAAWMASLGLELASLIGNSLGCNILVEFALHHGERIECLVLQGPTVDPGIRHVHQLLIRWLINARREPSMGGTLFKDYADAGLRRAVLTLRRLLHHRIEEKLPYVQAPTLVVRGTRDPLVTRKWARQVVHLLPRGRLIEIPGGRTYPQLLCAAKIRPRAAAIPWFARLLRRCNQGLSKTFMAPSCLFWKIS